MPWLARRHWPAYATPWARAKSLGCVRDRARRHRRPAKVSEDPYDLKQLFPAVRERGEPCQALARSPSAALTSGA
ncbi:hypothetical protein NUW54_g7963 [Trametes sanguinea]|uniref:Uncharacterized protein n=1 Tax=Trametes sanguinea TaxID=158606 RepID=A0ACC1PGP3_9APHY|nr:hypothetical protein NUW54_g7963 [Trametes sanguinea]